MQKSSVPLYFIHYQNKLSRLNKTYSFVKSESPEIFEKLMQTTLSGGKQLRPLLVLFLSEIFDLEDEKAFILASAAEMIHSASLCHDDVLDEAHIRRNLPTLNSLTGNKMAILSGDFLFSLALKHLCKLKNVQIVETASTMIASLSKGEWLQEKCLQNRLYSLEKIDEIAFNKTASLFSWALSAPILAKNSSDHEALKLAMTAGSELGLAFQRIDDILDFLPESGKENFIDLKKGILNAVSWDYFSSNHLLEKFQDKDFDFKEYCHLHLFSSSIEKIKKIASLNIENSNKAFLELSKKYASTPEKKEKVFIFSEITNELLKKI